MNAYFLRGVTDDNILVFRSADPEELLAIIRRLGASRDKQMRALAEQLETDWYLREYQNKSGDNKKKSESRRVPNKTRPKNSEAGKDRSGD